jgi:hypothetical protein
MLELHDDTESPMTKRHLIQAMLVLALVRSTRLHTPHVSTPLHVHERSTLAGRFREAFSGAERISSVLTNVPRHRPHQTTRHAKHS